MEVKEWADYLAPIVMAVAAFLLGKTGILNRMFDMRVSNVSALRKELEEYKLENKKLLQEQDKLQKHMSQLEAALHQTQDRLNLLLAYFRKNNPTNDEFLETLAKISQQTPHE